jgi:hypothetical protein
MLDRFACAETTRDRGRFYADIHQVRLSKFLKRIDRDDSPFVVAYEGEESTEHATGAVNAAEVPFNDRPDRDLSLGGTRFRARQHQRSEYAREVCISTSARG